MPRTSTAASSKEPENTYSGAPAQAAAVNPADWAQNALKLNRAIAWVSQTHPELKGDEKNAAVKERYVAIGGLLKKDNPGVAAKGRGSEVNMADHDGTPDKDDE